MHRLAVTLLLAAGCLDTPDPELSTSSDDVIVVQNGAKLTATTVAVDASLDLSKVVGLTACDAVSLYAVTKEAATTYKLWFSESSGQSWKSIAGGAHGPEIACDHGQLLNIDVGTQMLYSANTKGTGEHYVDVDSPADNKWQALYPVSFHHLQGGDGGFYATIVTGTGTNVFFASNEAHKIPITTWPLIASGLGSTIVTGAGTKTTGPDHMAVTNNLAWPKRAFTLETNGSISTNATLLAGQNWWAGLSTGTERYKVITAASSNELYGIRLGSPTTIGHIVIEESDCSDGIDNDFNGLTDAEDPKCKQPRANAYCSTHADGNYCSVRYEPATFLGQANQNTALVTCGNHVATAIKPGVCQLALPGTDRLLTENDLTPYEPGLVYSHYCNVHWTDGTWDLETGTDPCQTIRNKRPTQIATVVRAGMYSINGANHAFAVCSDGKMWGPFGSNGLAPITAAKAAIPAGEKKCVFQIAPREIPLFGKALDGQQGPTHGGFEHHSLTPLLSLDQFGLGETAPPEGASGVDRFGWMSDRGEGAYDLPVDESMPLYAVSGGVVLQKQDANPRYDGVRWRDTDAPGTPRQGEIYVRYSFGTSTTYRESFVVYYAHVRRWIVSPGQTVKAGQLIGFVGATGATSGGAHLHIGVFRTSNINAHQAADPTFGYHQDFQADSANYSGNNMSNTTWIDPLGWANYSAFDPWATTYYNQPSGSYTGQGAWSINLFKDGAAFPYEH